MGKMAAAEYEKVIGGEENEYLTSVQRQYQRSSIISNLKPMYLFVKIDP
jgi:hypothetical protein